MRQTVRESEVPYSKSVYPKDELQFTHAHTERIKMNDVVFVLSSCSICMVCVLQFYDQHRPSQLKYTSCPSVILQIRGSQQDDRGTRLALKSMSDFSETDCS